MEISNCSSDSKKLHEQIQDLNLKYEALEHKYNTKKLEAIEYRNRIDELEQDIEEHKLTNAQNKKRFSEGLFPVSPIVQLRMDNMVSEISENDGQIQELQEKVTAYSNTISELKFENDGLRKENENFRKSLILNNKQNQSQQITLLENKKEMCSLNTEIENLREELNTLQELLSAATMNTLQPSEDDTTAFNQSSPRVATETVRLEFTKTPGSVGGTLHPMGSVGAFKFAALMGFTSRSNVMSNVSSNVAKVFSNNMTYHTINSSSPELLDDINEANSLDSYDVGNEDVMKLKLKLEILEKENKELMRQIFVLGNNDEMKYIEHESDDDVDDVDDEEVNEMETLFRKCESGIDEKRLERNKNLKRRIEDGIIWWKCYENNICPVNVGSM